MWFASLIGPSPLISLSSFEKFHSSRRQHRRDLWNDSKPFLLLVLLVMRAFYTMTSFEEICFDKRERRQLVHFQECSVLILLLLRRRFLWSFSVSHRSFSNSCRPVGSLTLIVMSRLPLHTTLWKTQWRIRSTERPDPKINSHQKTNPTNHNKNSCRKRQKFA